jgi:DNA modification methylase
VRVLVGDVRDRLAELADESVHCVVTSPPYWGLRDYGTPGQLGLEATPEEYVASMVAVFRDVRRVLRRDGTCWLNLGDSYARDPAKGGSGPNGKHDFIPDYGKAREIVRGKRLPRGGGRWGGGDVSAPGLKQKDLCGIPWRVAFALQADGWYLRSDIIWSKPNPMPESVTDRPTKAHEYLFLLTRSPRYFYDADAIREPLSEATTTDARYVRALAGETPYGDAVGKAEGLGRGPRVKFAPERNDGNPDSMYKHPPSPLGRNRRSVWEIATEPYPEAHFATFPTALVEPCVKAGCPAGGTVLDPFAGSGTTLLVAKRLGREAIGIELNPVYAALVPKRFGSLWGQMSLDAIGSVPPTEEAA